MRVITGEYKGRKLEAPIGDDIRPTSDKVKESIFNLLMNETYDRVFCDLFCGTGSLGIEALSRGAARCYFIDRSRESIRLTIHNLKICGAEDRAIVLTGEYDRQLARIHEKVDVFLLDPPYHDGLYDNCLRRIDELDLLSKEGIIIAEHGSRDPVPEEAGNLIRVRQRRYGRIMLSIYRHREWLLEQSPEESEE